MQKSDRKVSKVLLAGNLLLAELLPAETGAWETCFIHSAMMSAVG